LELPQVAIEMKQNHAKAHDMLKKIIDFYDFLWFMMLSRYGSSVFERQMYSST